MKRFLSLLIVVIMLLSLAACGSETSEVANCCWSCGGDITRQAAFCEHCGASLKENSDTPTSGNSTTEKTPTTACDHSWKNATCTAPKTCEKCNLTEGKANGHWWHDATCTDARTCTVCLAVDPQSKPLGHSFAGEKCTRCGEANADAVQPTITASKTRLNLGSEAETIYITTKNADTVVYDIGSTSIVNCEWGEWDGDTIPLTIHPVSSGQTSVAVYIEDTDIKVSINVTVDKPNPYSLTIVGIGEEFETATGAYQNISVINSADYKVTDHIDYNNTVSFEVDVVATMIQAGDPPSFGALYTIGVDYELIDEDGVYVQTGNLWINVDYLNRPYSQTIYFFDLKPGDYTLKFSDNFY